MVHIGYYILYHFAFIILCTPTTGLAVSNMYIICHTGSNPLVFSIIFSSIILLRCNSSYHIILSSWYSINCVTLLLYRSRNTPRYLIYTHNNIIICIKTIHGTYTTHGFSSAPLKYVNNDMSICL